MRLGPAYFCLHFLVSETISNVSKTGWVLDHFGVVLVLVTRLHFTFAYSFVP